MTPPKGHNNVLRNRASECDWELCFECDGRKDETKWSRLKPGIKFVGKLVLLHPRNIGTIARITVDNNAQSIPSFLRVPDQDLLLLADIDWPMCSANDEIAIAFDFAQDGKVECTVFGTAHSKPVTPVES